MLNGIQVIEIEGLGPGPFAGMMLADLGADVIVIHRCTPPFPGWPERSLLDRGKRSICLDLKSPEDTAMVKQLTATADGLIEGFRPGVMERLGLGPEDLRAQNQKLVYGRMTGWGQTGPLAATVGHDLNYIGVSGALWYASEAGEPPLTPPTMVGDIGGGALYLVAGMLSGILKAHKTGTGCVVDAAIVDGSAHMMNLIMSMRQTGVFPDARGHSLLDGPHWSKCYQAADQKWLAVQCLEPHFYQTFLSKLDLQGDKDFQQQHNPNLWPQLSEKLSVLFRQQPLQHWVSLFEGTDACVAPVLSPSDAAHHPHMAARGTWQTPDDVLQASAAPRFDDSPVTPPNSAPKRDEHRAEILAALRT